MADLGTDLSCTAGLDGTFQLVTGSRAVAEAAFRRLTTKRGSLFYATDYGTDVREILNGRVDSSLLGVWRDRIVGEVSKDERIESAAAALTFDPTSGRLTVKVSGKTGEGPFAFTLSLAQAGTPVLT